MKGILFILILLSVATTAEAARCARISPGYVYAYQTNIYFRGMTMTTTCRVSPAIKLYWVSRSICEGRSIFLRYGGRNRTCRVTRLRFY